ncbi:His-Xaa-Ser repeat protein HxsA [Sphingosinicella sp. CPCC 101087]|uniref:His-Xaa-Ser repeat protein HxsA n=1 Tax=Sphingosinicella sp. CPCC 101087 TaxID=2497754 RepID=UPI00101D8E40
MASARVVGEGSADMSKRTFIIPSLAVAGFTQSIPAEAAFVQATSGSGGDGLNRDGLFHRFRLDHAISLAQHRSHSSHASHGSHRSGASGRVRTPSAPRTTPRAPRPSTPAPSRNQRSTPPSSVLPSSPAIAPSREATSVQSIVRQVQLALQALGYYTGTIDGISGPQTRAAIVRYQTDYSLKVTGTITPEVLNALRILAQ